MIEFTAEAREMRGLDALVAGRRFAFVVVVGEMVTAALGIAIEGEPGFNPIPEVLAHADDFEEMEFHADALNQAEGLDPKAAAAIIISTMRKRKVEA